MIAQKYDPSEIEPRWAREWVEQEIANPDSSGGSETYCIVIPPPNVTGVLHIGHALVNSIQDALIRRQRMRGKKTLWLPGTDHAGIATQNIVEKDLLSKGIRKEDLSREELVAKIWEWKEKSGNTIFKQLKRLGATLDWSRTRFTLDEGLSRAVRKTFVRFYREGLIYRGEYLVNWCPEDCTALSDLEVEHKEIEGELTRIAYPIEGEDARIEVETTRPETMLGDVAIAVHPEDERYRSFVGKNAIVPLVNRIIPIIGEEYVDPSFGTGALKITPAHDPNDFKIGKKHDLPMINVFTEDAKINAVYPELQGVDRFEARKQIVEKLKTLGLFLGAKKHLHNVGHSQRRGSIIEPRLSEQWFCKMDGAAQKVLNKIEAGELKVIPSNQHKILIDWLSGIHDWCISRQLCWGHQIPAWHCEDCSHIEVSEFEPPQKCSECGSGNLKQDEDVLDTWFSSGLFPFSTMGWPEETEDYRAFYPNSTLITGYDILFFWVARMLMMGEMLTEKLPFPEVFTHGLIRDQDGNKMSKSRGNVVDPLEIIDRYGADALRYTLLSGTVMGADLRVSDEIFQNHKFFMNKLWNAMRFTLHHLNAADESPEFKEESLNIFDIWLLSGLRQMVEDVNRNFDHYRFHEACNSLYAFIRDQFCDWYIEISKPVLFGKLGETERKNTPGVLEHVAKTILKTAHPFIPFITEEIWQEFAPEAGLLAIAAYPETEPPNPQFAEKAARAENFIAWVRSVRNIRGENNIAMNIKIPVQTILLDEDLKKDFQKYEIIAKNLGGLSEIKYIDKIPEESEQFATIAETKFEIFASLETEKDNEQETARLLKSKDKLAQKLSIIEKKLNNSNFLDNAPAAVIEKNKQEQSELESKIAKIERLLTSAK